MEDDFALRSVRIYPDVNSRAELVTLAPDLRPERQPCFKLTRIHRYRLLSKVFRIVGFI